MMDFKINESRNEREIIELLSQYLSYEILFSVSDEEKKVQMVMEKLSLIISLLYSHYDKQTQRISFYSYVKSGEDDLIKYIRVAKAYNPLSESSYSIIMDDEIRRYAFNICNTLAKLNLNVISSDSLLVNMYDEITTIIENSRIKHENQVENCAGFLIKTEFWELYFQFHDRYFDIANKLN